MLIMKLHFRKKDKIEQQGLWHFDVNVEILNKMQTKDKLVSNRQALCEAQK